MKNTTLRLNDKQGKEHDLDKNEMMVKESNITKPPEWKNREYSSMKEMNGEENDNFSQNWIWKSILTKKGWTELLENQQRKDKLDVGLWNTSQN